MVTKTLPVRKAVGSVLCHDITRIVPGETKGRAYKKRHIITETDVPGLLQIGTRHIYALDRGPGLVHAGVSRRSVPGRTAGPLHLLPGRRFLLDWTATAGRRKSNPGRDSSFGARRFLRRLPRMPLSVKRIRQGIRSGIQLWQFYQDLGIRRHR